MLCAKTLRHDSSLRRRLFTMLEQLQMRGVLQCYVRVSAAWLKPRSRGAESAPLERLWQGLLDRRLVYRRTEHGSDHSGLVVLAAAQEALDMLLASLVTAPDREALQPTRARDSNWVWDGRGVPKCPRVKVPSVLPKAQYPAVEAALTNAASLLLHEWTLGTAIEDYEYTDPYRDVDSRARHLASAAPGAPRTRATEPRRPTVGRASRPRVVRESALDSAHAAPASQPTAGEVHRSPQTSQSDAPMVQSQVESGRFAQRPAQPKRKKRVGGF